MGFISVWKQLHWKFLEFNERKRCEIWYGIIRITKLIRSATISLIWKNWNTSFVHYKDSLDLCIIFDLDRFLLFECKNVLSSIYIWSRLPNSFEYEKKFFPKLSERSSLTYKVLSGYLCLLTGSRGMIERYIFKILIVNYFFRYLSYSTWIILNFTNKKLGSNMFYLVSTFLCKPRYSTLNNVSSR